MALQWRTNLELRRAAVRARLSGLVFMMVRAEAGTPRLFEMRFAALKPAPAEQADPALLALQAVVALTLPDLATAAGLRLKSRERDAYALGLGEGVNIRGISLVGETDEVPLEVGGELSPGEWTVWVDVPATSAQGNNPVSSAIRKDALRPLLKPLGSLVLVPIGL